MRLIAVILCAMGLGFGGRSFGTELYVSVNGKDTNPGTKEKPLASVVAARDAVRKLVAAGLKEDVTVFLGGGTYYLPEGLTFGPDDSGTEKFGITYRALGDETPVLAGGQKVTGFEKHTDRIFAARLPAMEKGVKPRVASENGVRYVLARSPNEGYLGAEGGGGASIVYGADQLKELAGADASDGFVNFWQKNNWFNHVSPIKSVNAPGRQIEMQGGAISRGSRYYVMNVLAMLDQPGECQISATQGKLYVWPRKTPADAQGIAVATADNVIAIKGTKDKTVRNLHFEGMDITLANKDAVYITSAEDCSFRGCRIDNSWESGVTLHRAVQRITIADSEIRHVGLHGVAMEGGEIGEPYINKGHVVENNHIHHTGVVTGTGFGVRLSFSGDNKVVHNHIHHMARYAISFKGLTPPFIKDGGIRAKRYEYLHTRNNVVAYNHIHHADLESEDTGAIQAWGPGRDNVIDHNLVHDVGSPQFTLQSGIYLDDQADYFTVTNNVIYNVNGGRNTQVIYIKGIGNRIENNVLVVGKPCSAAIHTKASGEARDHVYTHNIVYFEHDTVLYRHEDNVGRRIAKCDENMFFYPNGGSPRTTGGGPAGADKNSIVADPLFVDAAKRDYRLKPDSPALSLGIKSIDMSAVGLTDKFPRRLDRE